MRKTILVTGATDGIGKAAAMELAALGHTVLLHGRSGDKLRATEKALSGLPGKVESYRADLSRFDEVEALAESLREKHSQLDVLINNAGIFKTPEPRTPDGLDMRFVVNTIAPWLLTQRLLPLMNRSGRIINLSSAAQSPVDVDALTGAPCLSDFAAYAQSKLAITMWTRHLAEKLGDDGPVVVAVNPGSLLATKMVKEAFGESRGEVSTGAKILVYAALDDRFSSASGKYFDNDAGRFGSPHDDALNPRKIKAVIAAIDAVLDNSSR